MRILFTFLFTAVLLFQSGAQQVAIDQSFNPSDKGFGKLNGEDRYGDDEVQQSIIQPDGKIVVSGFFSFINDTVRNCIARLNSDGTLDKSFKVYGFESDFGDGIATLKLQADGKILLCTIYPVFNNGTVHIIRLNADGTKDNTFKQAAMQYLPLYVRDIAIQADGKLIVAGEGGYAGYGKSIVRLNSNGSYDKTFLPDSINNYEIHSLAITSTGKIVAGGYYDIPTGSNLYQNIKAFNANGSYDNTFIADVAIPYGVTKIALQPDAKILFASRYYSLQYPAQFGRLNSNGTKDTSFKMGAGPDREVKAITLLSNGQLLIGGDFSKYNNVYRKGIARLNANGSLDNNFSSGAGISYNYNIGYPNIQTISIDKNGNYFIGGHFNVYNNVGAGGMLLLNTNGTVNRSFNPVKATGAEDAVFAIALQKDKKMLIAGDFMQYNGVSRNKIARLNADGTLDNSFTIGTGVQGNATDSNAYIHKLLIQADGKIIIGGNFSNINGQSRTLLARLNSNGSVDASFNAKIDRIYNYNYCQVSAIAQQTDGKLVVGIRRDNVPPDNASEPLLYRLKVDGTIDNTFKINTSFYGANDVSAIAVQSNGKILIGGDFAIISAGVTYNNIIQLNTDGSIDNTFSNNGNSTVGTDGQVTDLRIIPGGKIMVAGYFQSYNGARTAPVIRLNTKGLLDKTFKAATSLFKSDDYVLAPMSVDSNNVYIGFSSLYSSTLQTLHTAIYKFKSNGVLDSAYNTSASANSIVYATALDSTNHLLIGGSFTAFNGVGKNHISRLTAASTKRVVAFASNTTSFQSQSTTILIAPNPTKGNVYLQTYSSTDEQTVIKVINAQGKQLSQTSLIIQAGYSKQMLSLEKYAAGIYFIVVENSKGTQTFKVVKE